MPSSCLYFLSLLYEFFKICGIENNYPFIYFSEKFYAYNKGWERREKSDNDSSEQFIALGM